MKLLVHDYVGHPFQVQLSRGLAARGHTVLHVFSGSYLTPHGDLTVHADDPESFAIEPIVLNQQVAKYRFVQRFWLEAEYARRLTRICDEFRPDAVLSANAPSIVQNALSRWCHDRSVGSVFWIQDLYGQAAYRILSKKLPGLGHLVGKYFMRLDRQSAQMSTGIVAITEDFLPYFSSWNLDADRVHVIPNWAPLADLPQCPKDNSWASKQGLDPSVTRFLYSGTLSIRHNPEFLVQLAVKLRDWGNAELILVSEGDAAQSVVKRAAELGLSNVRHFGFQPFADMPEMMASADVLVSLLEADAGVFCVPSKVLTYMCAGRAQLLAVPGDNLVSRVVKRHEIGLVSEPSRCEKFLDNAEQLYSDAELRASCGRAAREFAELNFDFDRICDRFETILGCEQPATIHGATVGAPSPA
jgi:colanic acid biosynthesis glycosyl transferase WcaI